MIFHRRGLLVLLAVFVCRPVDDPSELPYQWFWPALECRQHPGRFPECIRTSVSRTVIFAAIVNTEFTDPQKIVRLIFQLLDEIRVFGYNVETEDFSQWSNVVWIVPLALRGTLYVDVRVAFQLSYEDPVRSEKVSALCYKSM